MVPLCRSMMRLQTASPMPGALVFLPGMQTLENLEHTFEVFRINANSLVCPLQLTNSFLPVLGAKCISLVAALLQNLMAFADQVLKYLHELSFIPFYGGQWVRW